MRVAKRAESVGTLGVWENASGPPRSDAGAPATAPTTPPWAPHPDFWRTISRRTQIVNGKWGARKLRKNNQKTRTFRLSFVVHASRKSVVGGLLGLGCSWLACLLRVFKSSELLLIAKTETTPRDSPTSSEGGLLIKSHRLHLLGPADGHNI